MGEVFRTASGSSGFLETESSKSIKPIQKITLLLLAYNDGKKRERRDFKVSERRLRKNCWDIKCNTFIILCFYF
jgi:hypothetical protein